VKRSVAVLGAGSWGTALAMVLADNGHHVTLWGRNAETVDEINARHTNRRYLPGAVLPAGVMATTDLASAVSAADAVVVVTPSHAVREVVRRAAPHLSDGTLVVHAAKGLETDTLKRMSEVIGEELPASLGRRVAVLSGPSHAEEVCRKSPTTVVVAAEDPAVAQEAQDLFINTYFRVYTNPDVTGVELGGALKNIIALGAGLSDGLGYGDNAKAALITRGLAEIGRLGYRMGANPLTFAGLAGVGDLVVTCTSRHSRNWRAGYQLGQGASLEDVLARMGMVVEGVRTTKAAYRLAARYGVEMPITQQLYAVLFEGKPPKQAVEELMGRDRTREWEWIVQVRDTER
jgi:Glycerol-3-phosphate dehydrogenase